jgi:glycosyltransferase involved in cell wall biosynthesis
MTTDGAPEILGCPAVSWIPCSTLTEPANHYPTTSSERIELLFVGRLAPSKGVELLLEALRAAPQRFRLTVVGDGPERARLEASAPADVLFVGAVGNAEVIRRMRAAHVVVVPSHKRGIRLQEGMPTVIAEAMSQARPVLASAVGGVPHVFQRDGAKPGWLVEPDSVAALVRGLEAVAEADLESASRAAASTYNEVLSSEAVLDAYERAYEAALLAQPEPSDPSG